MAAPSLKKIAYHTLQQGKTLAGLAHKELSTKLMEVFAPEAAPEKFPVDKDLIKEVRRSMENLERIDWQEAEAGVYPKSLLFEAPWLEWAKKYPLVWLDMPQTWNRRKKNQTREIPRSVNEDDYPNYYLQNFHHQTDGYLSEHSAEIYDLQVEILFNGTADSMRRRVLAPLKRGVKKYLSEKSKKIKVLDIATGTGRTLQQIQSALPEVELYGIDLSGSYLKQASKYLSSRSGDLVQLTRGNAENMPYESSSFQALTCVFLFHELPRNARKNVLKECFRLLEPGGTLILADSIQIEDSPKFTDIMENFHKIFHEPYYRDYIIDNIDLRLEESGFTSISSESHFMTKVWKANKPA
ncbi:class I SAM-dependent methyltransferase [Prochlorococcus marinus]|uniref:SAM-dependent methyltransferase n=1 Tax=Prochlorococcus marinus XMU1408 TaxID=2213228 RepID=A0A318RGC6_PROMR|nr:class I SAM-dependent methyltransferase [Prochlorococcus marinus]MBW3041737.1 SAM-dependent methyltransferase [Prochlorococcus marinus str. XMU1408]PYE02883.1 SAM-dependent methyltransferase [Prochlorococcus marinus XMU1408]